MNRTAIWIAFVLSSLIWGSTWLVITGQLGVVPPPWSVAYRFMIGAAVMFIYARISAGSIRLGRDGHLFAMLFGIPQFCFNFNAVYLAERHVTSGLVAVVYALLIVPNALLAWLLLKHRISGRFLAGAAVAIAGVGLLFWPQVSGGVSASGSLTLGIGLTLVGILSASVANVMQALDRVRVHSMPVLLAWGMTYGVIADVVFALVTSGPPVWDMRPTYWLGLAYLGVIASALVFSLYFPLIRTIGPGKAAYTGLIIPVIAMLLSSIFEGYVWTPIPVAGAVLALLGLFIALRPEPRPA